MKVFRTGRIRRGLELGAAALIGGAVATVGVSQLHIKEAQAKSEWDNPYFPFEQLGRVLAWVENEYVDPVERRRLVEGAIKGMVAELDPHSSYLPAEDYGIFQADTEGHFGGIGVEVDFGDEYITIIAPIDGSPAALGGIMPGDRILAIDNQAVRGKSAADLVRMMRGEPNTKVLLTIRRKGNEIRTISLGDEAWTVLSSIPAHLTGKWLFWHGDGDPYRNVSARFHELVESAQKSAQQEQLEFRPFTFHHLRHYYSVEYLKNGGNIYRLQQHLNHKSITTTELYLKFLTPEEAMRAKHGSAQNPAQLEGFDATKNKETPLTQGEHQS